MPRKKIADKDEKTETITIRISPYDKELVERASKKDGMSVSQYILSCIYTDMLLNGDVEMMKRSLSVAGEGARTMVREMFFGKKKPNETGGNDNE